MEQPPSRKIPALSVFAVKFDRLCYLNTITLLRMVRSTMEGKSPAFHRILSMALVLMLLLAMIPLGDVVNLTAYGTSIGTSPNTLAGISGTNVTTKVTMNGNAMPGVIVHVQSVGTTWSTFGTTGINGEVTLDVNFNHPAHPEYYFFVAGTAHYTAYCSDVFNLTGNNPPQDIELVTGYPVASTVTIDGVPAENIPVRLQVGYDTYYDAISGTSGAIAFDNIPYASSWYTYFTVEESDQYRAYQSDSFDISSTAVYPEISLTGNHTISIPITQVNGQPAPNDLRVELYQKQEYYDRQTAQATVVNGAAVFQRIPTGAGYYAKVDADYTTVYNGKEAGDIFSVPGTPPNIVVDIGNTISSVVTIQGQPKSGVRVSLYGSNGYITSQTSDENGIVSFSMLAANSGYYFKVNETSEFAAYSGRTYGLEFSVPGTAPNIALEAGNTLTTRATLNGQPIADAEIHLYNVKGGTASTANTDSDGVATFPKVATTDGYYFYVYGGPGYSLYDGEERGMLFSVPGTTPNIELAPGYAASTKVMLNGVPQSGYLVYLYMASQGLFFMDDWFDYDYTESDGTITFEGLPAGKEYYFYVPKSNQSLEYDGRELGKTFTMPSDSVPVIELDPGHTITTTVTFNGNPVPNQDVYLRGRLEVNRWMGTTDTNGVVTIAAIPPGNRYYFEISAPDGAAYADYSGNMNRAYFTVPGTTPASIELEPANNISTRVFIDGVPASGIVVTIQNSSYAKSATSDGNGLATFNNLPQADNCFFRAARKEGSHAKYTGTVFGVRDPIPDIHLETGNMVTTHVTMNGQPVSGASVHLDTGEEYIHAKSDSTGAVTIPNVTSTGLGYFRVTEKAGKYANYSGYYLGKTFAIPAQSYPEIVLTEGETIAAMVTYRGVPQKNIQVHLWEMQFEDGWYDRDSAMTDEQGKISFSNVGAGRYAWEAMDASGMHHFYGPYENATFSIPGVVPNIELDPNYRSGSFGGSPDSSSSSGSGSSSSDGNRGAPSTAASPTDPARTTGPVTVKNAMNLAEQASKNAEKEKQSDLSFRIKNPESISLEAMKAMVAAAKGMPIKFHADSMLNTGTVDVRITIDPSMATKDIKLSGSAQSNRTRSLKTFFEKWYKNKVQVVSFAQQDTFGMPVEVSLKLGDERKGKTLVLYSYDKKANTYKRIENANYRIDKNGYLHFTTEFAGDIVISDGALAYK